MQPQPAAPAPKCALCPRRPPEGALVALFVDGCPQRHRMCSKCMLESLALLTEAPDAYVCMACIEEKHGLAPDPSIFPPYTCMSCASGWFDTTALVSAACGHSICRDCVDFAVLNGARRETLMCLPCLMFRESRDFIEAIKRAGRRCAEAAGIVLPPDVAQWLGLGQGAAPPR